MNNPLTEAARAGDEAAMLATCLKAGVRLEWRPLVRVPAALADGMGSRGLQALASALGQSVLAEDKAEHHGGTLYQPDRVQPIQADALASALEVLGKAAMF